MDIKEFLKPNQNKIIIFIVLLILISVSLVLYSGQYPYMYSINSESMTPELNKGDLVFIKTVEEISVGDVIAFTPIGRTYPIVHRVISLEGGIQTKADNNAVQDPFKINLTMVHGKMIFSIPYLGYLDMFHLGGLFRVFLIYVLSCVIIYSGVKKK
ncbi:MAG: signal peptidase I [Nanoarchaeota archaeon]|nr:signal peptidase I [Nanoarchaeota archaeon]